MASRTQFDLSFLSLKPAELNAFLGPYTETIKTSKVVTSDVIQYSFYSVKNQLPDSAINDPDVRGPVVFSPFTAAEQNTAKTILSMLEISTGLKFEQVAAGEGELRFGKYNMQSGFAGYTYNPGDFGEGYTPLFINSNMEGKARPFTQTFLHELGHALNFKHPGIYDTGDTPPPLPANLDTSLLSVMSYSDYEYNVSYSPLDLMAYMSLYGTNPNPTPKQYIFTANGSQATQSVSGDTYHINMVGNDMFWVVDGPHTYDFSKTVQGSQGLYVNTAIGAIRWTDPQEWLSINAWNSNENNSVETLARISDSANVRFLYPNAGATTASGALASAQRAMVDTGPVSNLILSDNEDMIVMLDDQSVFNFIDTGGGSDRFIGFIDGVVLDGGEGLDDMQLFGERAEYYIARIGSGFSITDPQGDKLTIEQIDRLHFDDFSIAFDYEGSAGEIYRAYAALARTPDLQGMGYWLYEMDAGLSETAMVSSIVHSEEFATLYAGTDDSAFVQKLYLNVLNREADELGQSYWISQLNNGASRESVVYDVTHSAESVILYANAGHIGMSFQEWEWLGNM